MTEPCRLGLHIGLPKTGTTSLQELVLARHPGIRYFGQTNLWQDGDSKAVLRALLLDGEPTAPALEAVQAGLAESGAVVISDEALTLGEFMLRATRWPVVSDHVATARRARQVLGDAHVLIVLRNQPDLLESWHRQGLKTGKYAEVSFDRWLARDLGAAADRLFELLRFDRLYHAWADAFGPERVHVKLYEHYRERFPELAAEAMAPLGVDGDRARALAGEEPRNVTDAGFEGLPPTVQHLVRRGPVRRLLSAVPRRPRRALRRMLEFRRSYEGLGDDRRAAIRDHFAASNESLFRELGLDGAAHGYL